MLWGKVHFSKNEVMSPPWVEGKRDIVWPDLHHNFALILNPQTQTHRAQKRNCGTKRAYFQNSRWTHCFLSCRHERIILVSRALTVKYSTFLSLTRHQIVSVNLGSIFPWILWNLHYSRIHLVFSHLSIHASVHSVTVCSNCSRGLHTTFLGKDFSVYLKRLVKVRFLKIKWFLDRLAFLGINPVYKIMMIILCPCLEWGRETAMEQQETRQEESLEPWPGGPVC